MIDEKRLSFTQKRVLSTLMTSDNALTITEIAQVMGVHRQTVANYIPDLVAQNHIEEAGKKHNAMTYVIGDPASNLVGIKWQGEHVSINKLLTEIVDGTTSTPVGRYNPFAREIIQILATLYKLSADATDEDQPRPLSLATLQRIQSTLATRRRIVRNLLDTYDSLLNNDVLFNPQQLVKELIIKDPETDHVRARSIHEGINRELGGDSNN